MNLYLEEDYLALISSLENISEIEENGSQLFLVEIVRQLAEYIIYSEQNKKGTYFEIFMERNMLENFTNLLYLNNRNVSM